MSRLPPPELDIMRIADKEIAEALSKTICDLRPSFVTKYPIADDLMLCVLSKALLNNAAASMGASVGASVEETQELLGELNAVVKRFLRNNQPEAQP